MFPIGRRLLNLQVCFTSVNTESAIISSTPHIRCPVAHIIKFRAILTSAQLDFRLSITELFNLIQPKAFLSLNTSFSLRF